MNIKKKSLVDIIVVGAAMFSMFFGAGNMIFPPYLGFSGGTDWLSGFIGYFIADIGLVILSIVALVRMNGQEMLLKPIGRITGSILLFVIIMCLGPVISIPRTAATTYELFVTPSFGKQEFPWFYVVFFVIVLIMCIKKSSVVDIVGKILTPLLFVGLLSLIIIGILEPIGGIDVGPRTNSAFADGIEAGYQSMDVLGAIVFGALIISSVADKGYKDLKNSTKIIMYASVFAGLGLFIVYLGLTYLGATSCTLYSMHTLRTELLINIVSKLVPGKTGIIIFGVTAALACLSTAVALTGSAAEYLSRLTNGKINYKVFVVAICVVSALTSSLGVDKLVKLASPLLSIVYPPVLTTVIISFFDKYVGSFSYKFAGYTAMVFGVYDAVSSFGLRMNIIDAFPLQEFGLGWLVPSFFAFLIGFMIDRKIKRTCRN